MAKTKIDWESIRTDYISNPLETLLSLAGKYNVNYGTITQKASDDDWAKLRQETSKLVQDKTIEKVADKIAMVNARQASLGVALQAISIKAIQEKDENGEAKIKAKTPDEVRLLALTGVTIERQALNINKESNQPIAIQINFGSPEVDEWAT